MDVHIWYEYAHGIWQSPFALATTEDNFEDLEIGSFWQIFKFATAVMIGYAVHKREDQEARDASRLRPGYEYIFNRDGIIARKFYWR